MGNRKLNEVINTMMVHQVESKKYWEDTSREKNDLRIQKGLKTIGKKSFIMKFNKLEQYTKNKNL